MKKFSLFIALLTILTLNIANANIVNNGINTGDQTELNNSATGGNATANGGAGGSVTGNILTGGTSNATGGNATGGSATGGSVLASGNSTSNSGGNTVTNTTNPTQTNSQTSSPSQSMSNNVESKRFQSVGYAQSFNAQKGTTASSVGSFLGSISLSDSELQEVEATRTQIIVALAEKDLITNEQAKVVANKIVKNLDFASRPRRFLGFGWKTQGKSLENLFGLLSWTSFRGND